MADFLNNSPRASLRSAFAVPGIAAAIALACVSAPLAAGVKDGVDAWSAGDYDRAVSEWTGPAANGDPDALFNLAQAYRLGRGVEADIDRARQLYAEAAQKGHVKAADNYGLLLFQQGKQESAMPLIRNAADRGDPRAQYVLGLAHFNADYASKDWVRAYALLTLSRSQGLPQAKDALAQMDRYVPQPQREMAQSLARELEDEAARRRAAELAAADLGRPVGSGADLAVEQGPGKAGQPPVTLASATLASATAAPAAKQPLPAQADTEAAPARVAKAYQVPPVRVETAARPVPDRKGSASASKPATGGWRIQLGAFGVEGNAERLWRKLAGNPALAGTQKALVPSGRVTRLQAVGYPGRTEAQRACASLKRQGQACLVFAPRS